ncbi:MAG: methionyl-tRNA formyltransferase [Mycobacteriaceae bacterium]
MRIIFAGTPAVAIPSLQRLIDSSEHEIIAVITRPDAVAGRGRKVSRSPVAQLADQHAIPVLAPSSAADPSFIAEVVRLAPDCCPVVAYGALLPTQILDIPTHGWINLHFSLLPAWRGAAPVQAAIAAGDEVTGVSTFRIEQGLDTGPVFGVVTERVLPTDNSGDLLDRLADSGAQLLESTLDGLATGVLVPVPQSAEGVSIAPKISVESARINWNQSAMVVDRHIRSVTPFPGAWTYIDQLRVKIGSASIAEFIPELDPGLAIPPGQIVSTKKNLYVGTTTEAIRLELLQPQGKKMMPASDWARGARIQIGALAR